MALRDLRSDLVLRGGYHSAKPLEPAIGQQQDLIRWCEHLVVVSPDWWWSASALLTGFVAGVRRLTPASCRQAQFPSCPSSTPPAPS